MGRYSCLSKRDIKPVIKFVKAVIEPDFVDWQGQYKVNHFEVNEVLDARIRLFFARG